MERRTLRKGRKVRWQVIGAETMDRIYAETDATTRPMQDYVTGIAWGEIWTRPGLPPRTRILLNLALLTAVGELRVIKYHIRAALDLGCSKREIRESLIHTSSFVGLLRALAACTAAKEVFDEIEAEKRAGRAKRRA